MLSAVIKVSFGSGQQSAERKVTGQSAEDKRLVLSPITHPMPGSRQKERESQPMMEGVLKYCTRDEAITAMDSQHCSDKIKPDKSPAQTG